MLILCPLVGASRHFKCRSVGVGGASPGNQGTPFFEVAPKPYLLCKACLVSSRSLRLSAHETWRLGSEMSAIGREGRNLRGQLMIRRRVCLPWHPTGKSRVAARVDPLSVAFLASGADQLRTLGSTPSWCLLNWRP